MMAGNPSKLDQLRTLREAHLLAVENAKAASEIRETPVAKSPVAKKLVPDA
jgi:hypothetical protein